MTTILGYYWPMLVACVAIGIVSGVLAYRGSGPKRRK